MMSAVIDEIRAEIQAKLDEIENEANPLREALAALGNGSSPSPAAHQPAPVSAPTKPKTPGRKRVAAAQYADEAILNVIRTKAGDERKPVGAAEVREVLGGNSHQLSMRLKKLVDQKQLLKLGERRESKYLVVA